MPAEVVTLRFDVEDRGSRDVEKIEQRTGSLNKRLDQLSGKTGAAGAAMDKLANGPVGRLASRFASVAAVAVTTTAAIVAVGVAVGAMGLRKGAADALAFSAAMAEVSTLVDDASVSISGLGNDVRDISVRFGQDPTSQARAVYQGLSAGAFEAADSIGFLTDANILAQAGVTDVATSVEGLLAVMKPYQIEADRAAEISDKLFLTVKRGITTIPELAGALGQVTPLASQVGLSVDELLGSIAAITSATKLSTTETTTQISALLRALLQASERTRQVAADTGIAFDEIFSLKNFREKGLVGFLGELDDALRKTGAREETLFKLTGRAEALNAVLALTGPAAKDLTRNIQELGSAQGTAAGAADKVAASTAQRFKELGAAFDDYLSTTATQFVDVFAEFAPDIKAFLVDVTAFIRENSEQIKAIIHGMIEVATIAFKALYVAWDLTGTRALSLAGNLASAGTAAALLGTSVAGATAAAKANAVANAAGKNALATFAQASAGVVSQQQAIAAATKAGILSSRAFWTSMAHGASLALLPLEIVNLTLIALTSQIKRQEEALRKFNAEKEALASDQSIQRFNAALASGNDAQINAALDSVRQSANFQEIGTSLAKGTRQQVAEYEKLKAIIDGSRASIRGLTGEETALERQTVLVGAAFSQLGDETAHALLDTQTQLKAIQNAPASQGRDDAILSLVEQIDKLETAAEGLKDRRLREVVSNYAQAVEGSISQISATFDRAEAEVRRKAGQLAEAREQALLDVGRARFDFLGSEEGKQRGEKLAIDLQPFELEAADPSRRASLVESQRADAQRIAEERLRREVSTLDEQIVKLTGINEATKERNSLIEKRLEAETKLFDFHELSRAAAAASAAEDERKLAASRASLAVKMEETDLARRLASFAQVGAPESSTLAARLEGEQAIESAKIEALKTSFRQAETDAERLSLAEDIARATAEQRIAAVEGENSLQRKLVEEGVLHDLLIERIGLEGNLASLRRKTAAEEVTSRERVVDLVRQEFDIRRGLLANTLMDLEGQKSIAETSLVREEIEARIKVVKQEQADLGAVQAAEEKRRIEQLKDSGEATAAAKAISKAWTEVANAISGAATNALLDYINGTKSAEEAFRQFATNVLQLIQRIIVETLVAVAIQTLLGVNVGGVGGAIAGAFFHDGGPVRKYHSGGLAADEVPAVLQAGEYVMSRRGVNAAGLPTLEALNRGTSPAPALGPDNVSRVIAMGSPKPSFSAPPRDSEDAGGAGASGGYGGRGGEKVERVLVMSEADIAEKIATSTVVRASIAQVVNETRNGG